jgi:hypothetical protein
MRDLENNQRWMILVRSQGNNTHLGLELETEEYSSFGEALKDIEDFLRESCEIIEERFKDDEDSDS